MTDSSLLASITSWFTPTALFLFVNLVIGTIALTSRFASSNKLQDDQQHQVQLEHPTSEHLYDSHTADLNPLQLARAPSLLQRVKSNLFSYKFPDPEEEQPLEFQATETLNGTSPFERNPSGLARAPSFLERVKSIKLPSVYKPQQTEIEVDHDSETDAPSDPGHNPKRSKSEGKKYRQRVEGNVKKSISESSMKVGMENDETERETVERRTPQKARLHRTLTIGHCDQSIDAKAHDFINKFRRQLKLQRLD